MILCGSSISFVEKEILSEKSPIFGRRTNQIFLHPFDYIESAYEVTDSMYRFWYSFIPGARAAIEMNRGEVFYKN
ncbi:MAG: hypothetical protein IKN79_10715, partial [Eubacterium sp.]|nr:hypothetical protein [Eubacterium sp.]